MSDKGARRRLAGSRVAPARPAVVDEDELLRLEQACAALAGLLPPPSLSEAERRRRRTRWGRHVPALAPLLGDVLDAEPALLGPLGGDAAALRAQVGRVRRLTAVRALLADFAARAADLLLVEKSDLHDECQRLVHQLELAVGSALVPAEDAARIAAAATPALHLLSGRQAEIRRTRRRRARLRSGDEEAADLEELPAPPPALRE